MSLIVALGFFLMSLPISVGAAATTGKLPPQSVLLCVGVGVFFFLLAAYLWFRSVSLASGDDLFSDQRGFLMSLMLVTILVVGGGATWLASILIFGWVRSTESWKLSATDASRLGTRLAQDGDQS